MPAASIRSAVIAVTGIGHSLQSSPHAFARSRRRSAGSPRPAPPFAAGLARQPARHRHPEQDRRGWKTACSNHVALVSCLVLISPRRQAKTNDATRTRSMHTEDGMARSEERGWNRSDLFVWIGVLWRSACSGSDAMALSTLDRRINDSNDRQIASRPFHSARRPTGRPVRRIRFVPNVGLETPVERSDLQRRHSQRRLSAASRSFRRPPATARPMPWRNGPRRREPRDPRSHGSI